MYGGVAAVGSDLEKALQRVSHWRTLRSCGYVAQSWRAVASLFRDRANDVADVVEAVPGKE